MEVESILESKAYSYHTPATLQSLTSSMRSEGPDDLSLSRRLSTSSLNSVDELSEQETREVYSEEEMQSIHYLFTRLFKQYFSDHSIECIPASYYSLLDEIFQQSTSVTYFDNLTLDILETLFSCIQIRLFNTIFNEYYPSFVVTDLFEYVVNDIRFPSTPQMNFSSLRRATKYTMTRLQSCEEEIPHVRKFIQRTT